MCTRIVSDPAVLGGKPTVKGTRISVEFLLELFASGATRGDVLQAYPHLRAEDIEEALRYATQAGTVRASWGAGNERGGCDRV